MILVALLVVRIFYNNQLDLKQRLQRPKLILVYGSPPAYEPWVSRNSEEAKNYKFADWDGTPCEETRCQITFDKNMLPISDAVLVHNFWLKIKKHAFEEISSISKRPLEQRWVFYTKESSGNYPLSPQLNGFFNWTATYRRDSDFFVPYGSYAPLKEQSELTGTADGNKTHPKPSICNPWKVK